MAEPFDGFEFVEYLGRTWRVPLIACIVALAITLTLSLLQQKRYTAVATIIIDPPGTSDGRVSTSVSPMYLESLKTYEQFAASDSLFAQAASKFHLQDGGQSRSIESLKKQVLRVTKLRDTKILEIHATLPEPKLAQSFVQYLAEQAVALSRNENSASDRDLMESASRQLEDAERRFDLAKTNRNQDNFRSVTSLQTETDANVDLLAKLQQTLAESKADLAGYEERERANASPGARNAAGDPDASHQVLREERARVANLSRQVQDLQSSIANSSASLSVLISHREDLDAEVKMARTAYEAAANRVGEMRAATGTRDDRLRIIDRGIVPQRPSSPNIPLNLLVSALVALVASTVYLSLVFAYRQRGPARLTVSRSRAS